MKKMIVMALMLVGGISTTFAQSSTSELKPAEIKFDKVSHNFGTFSEKDSKVTCSFGFTNVGEQDLVINQAIATCGCTVPSYTKTPIKPGEKGEIKVAYNGAGKVPGHVTKSINARTHGAVEMTSSDI